MLKSIIIFIILAYLGITLLAYFFSNKMIFLPPYSGYTDAENILKITTQNGAKISAIYLKNANAKYTLLVSHGNAEDIGYLLPFLKELYAHNFSVFAYDYQGYGTSTGTPTEQHAYEDINAAYAYLVNNLHIPPKQIIAYGTSVGSAVTIDLASRKSVAGVIVQGPFVSAYRVVTHIPLLPFDKFNNLAKIDKINCSILIMHGTRDFIVPFWHGKKLYKKAKEPKQHLWVKGAGHNDFIDVAGDQFWQALDKFTESLKNGS
jgi:fermentation-respiration switch protein FrsA (DUF1100 family)